MKKFGKFILIIFGVIIAIGIISSFGDDESSDSGSNESNKTEAKVEKEEAKVYQIGEKVEVGKLSYEVTNVSTTNEIKSDNEYIESATTEGQFVIIDIKAYNNDSEARMVDSTMFKIKDDQDREFEPTSDVDVAMVVDSMSDFFLQDINPGLSASGKVVFELPADVGYYLF